MTSTHLLGAPLVALALSGCHSSSPLFHPERADDMREAGGVHLAVLAVAPWGEYASALQPDFSLSSDAAVDEVARDSRWQRQENVSGAQAGVQSTLLVQPKDPNDLRFPSSAGSSAPVWSDSLQFLKPSVEKEPDGTPHIGPDSMLKYTAATALYQEVQLLNRHIRDAAIPAGFRPYMVRLQLSLMPSRRHAPYDAYTTVSFFVPGERGEFAALELADARPIRSTSDEIFARPFGNGPKVLPLVVTDNLEASVQSRSLDRIRGLTASLLDFARFNIVDNNTTFAGDVVKPMYTAMLAKAMRDEVFGRDLNSLLTVARLSENTLRIRLGAMQEATADYAMVPRNHNITLLLMVPEGAPALVEVVSKTVLVDTETGEPLDAPSERERVARLLGLRRAWGLEDVDVETLSALHGFAQQNDQERFAALLSGALPVDHPARALERSIWIELVGLRIGDQYASNLFELPGQGRSDAVSTEVFESQTVVAEDNSAFAYVTLREARFPESEQVLAVLRSPSPRAPSASASAPAGEQLGEAETADGLEPAEESGAALDGAQSAEPEPAVSFEPEVTDATRIVLPAESVKSDVARRELRLRFPSLLRWGLANDGDPLELELRWAGEKRVFPAKLRQLAAIEDPGAVPHQRKALQPARDFDPLPKTSQEP